MDSEVIKIMLGMLLESSKCLSVTVHVSISDFGIKGCVHVDAKLYGIATVHTKMPNMALFSQYFFFWLLVWSRWIELCDLIGFSNSPEMFFVLIACTFSSGIFLF